jgi:hypothetical protein
MNYTMSMYHIMILIIMVIYSKLGISSLILDLHGHFKHALVDGLSFRISVEQYSNYDIFYLDMEEITLFTSHICHAPIPLPNM